MDTRTELENLFHLSDRLFEDVLRPGADGIGMPLAFYETPSEYVVEWEVPGVKAEDIHVAIEGPYLLLKAKREAHREEKSDDRRYFRSERAFGEFQRQVMLPSGVDTEKVNAHLKDGVLTLKLPKVPSAQPKPIPVATA